MVKNSLSKNNHTALPSSEMLDNEFIQLAGKSVNLRSQLDRASIS
jgi:hypothetical protein